MAANCQDVADVLSWTSASGIARSLYINKSWNEGCRGALSRAFLVLLLAVPLVLGLAELTLGIVFRHQPDGCPYPLPVWLIIDGVAALLTAILSLLDIARVHALSTDDEDDSENARKARTKALGPYACTGVAVIFLIPLFRLVWLLYGLDILHRIGACCCVRICKDGRDSSAAELPSGAVTQPFLGCDASTQQGHRAVGKTLLLSQSGVTIPVPRA